MKWCLNIPSRRSFRLCREARRDEASGWSVESGRGNVQFIDLAFREGVQIS